MKTSLASSKYTLAAGQIVEREKSIADQWIKAGIAEPVAGETKAKRSRKATSVKAKKAEKR